MNKMAVFLIPIGIAINFVGGQLAVMLKLPLFLDAIGTIVVGALCGILPGIIVGVGSNLINAISMPTLLPYAVISLVMGIMAAVLSKRGWFKTFPKSLASGVLYGLVCCAIAVPITVTLYGGFVGTGASVIVTTLMTAGWSVFSATVASELFSELCDKIATLIIVFFVLKSMPKRFLVKLPLGKYYLTEEEAESLE